MLYRIKDRYFYSREGFNIVRCENCGLIYLNPQPDLVELKKHYSRVYFPRLNQDKMNEKSDDRFDIKCRNRLNEVLSFSKSGKVLDIGCSDGYFLNYLKQKGWQVEGVEISEFASQKTRERYNINIFCGELPQAGYPDEYFDVVSLFEVLEHLPDPAGTLQEVRRILKKNGLLIMTVPNFDSLQRLLFGKYWHIIDPPRHLFYFSKTTLNSILVKCNFNKCIIEVIDGAEVLGINKTRGYSESWRTIFKKPLILTEVGARQDVSSLRTREESIFIKNFLHHFEVAVFMVPYVIAKLFSREDTLLIKAIK